MGLETQNPPESKALRTSNLVRALVPGISIKVFGYAHYLGNTIIRMSANTCPFDLTSVKLQAHIQEPGPSIRVRRTPGESGPQYSPIPIG